MSSQYLQIKSTTSNRDSHGLFDYESSQVTKDSLKVTSSGLLQIKGNLISFVSESESPSSEQILRLYHSESDYVICPSKQNRVGLVVKHIKNNQKRGHKLSVGDMLRLGRVKLKVQKLCVSNEKDESGDELEGSNAGELCCRICFRTHTNPIDPLLAICKCSGSMAYTHIKCLRK